MVSRSIVRFPLCDYTACEVEFCAICRRLPGEKPSGILGMLGLSDDEDLDDGDDEDDDGDENEDDALEEEDVIYDENE